ncbi:MAG: hypothetical protein WC438_03940 [Candidatus Pacearchaeota archaeon]
MENSQKFKDYEHETDWKRHFSSSMLSPVFSWGPLGPPRNWTSYVKFYEGILQDGKEKILFFLEYEKGEGDKNDWKSIGLTADALIAECHYKRSKDPNQLGNLRFEDFQTASQMFESLGIPEDLWNRKGIALMQAYYNQFAKDARITVPGYISETFFEDNKITSKVIPIRKKNQSEIEKRIRNNELNGEIRFW